MTRWLHQIIQQPQDAALLAQALAALDAEAEVYADKIAAKGRVLVGVAADIPDLSIKVHTHWSEIGAIYDLIKGHRLAAVGRARRHYTETYERMLNPTQIEKYVEVDPAVTALDVQLIQIDFIKARWEAVSKGLERLHYLLRTIAEMRQAGLEDATL